MKFTRNEVPAMPRWRAWLARVAAFVRRLFGRLRGDPLPPHAPPPADAVSGENAAAVRADATPVRAVAPSSALHAQAAPAADPKQATPAALPPSDAGTLHVEPPMAAIPATDAPAAAVSPPESPTARPAVRARRSRWQSDTMRIATGRIDLAPWVPPERTYRVFVPAKLSPDPCIVMMLHGCKQTPEDLAEGTRLNEHAEDLGWIVVYPEQARAANKYGCWNWFDPANERGDGECALVMAIHAAVRARLKLNEPRSFLAGMSAGGALASLLALRFARHWAGVAIHSGLPYAAARDPWGAQRAMREGAPDLVAAAKLKSRAVDTSPLPAVIMHGNEDTVVNRRNADLLVRQFLGWNGYFPDGSDWATAPAPPAVLTHSSTTYGHPYILRDFGEGLHPPVRECEVVGMGHAWSGGDSAVPFHDEMGPDASALMMEFFATIAERG